MVTLDNGCVCCTFSDDMIADVISLAKRGEVDYVVIEAPGFAPPQETASDLTYGVNESNEALHDFVFVGEQCFFVCGNQRFCFRNKIETFVGCVYPEFFLDNENE